LKVAGRCGVTRPRGTSQGRAFARSPAGLCRPRCVRPPRCPSPGSPSGSSPAGNLDACRTSPSRGCSCRAGQPAGPRENRPHFGPGTSRPVHPHLRGEFLRPTFNDPGRLHARGTGECHSRTDRRPSPCSRVSPGSQLPGSACLRPKRAAAGVIRTHWTAAGGRHPRLSLWELSRRAGFPARRLKGPVRPTGGHPGQQPIFDQARLGPRVLPAASFRNGPLRQVPDRGCVLFSPAASRH